MGTGVEVGVGVGVGARDGVRGAGAEVRGAGAEVEGVGVRVEAEGGAGVGMEGAAARGVKTIGGGGKLSPASFPLLPLFLGDPPTLPAVDEITDSSLTLSFACFFFFFFFFGGDSVLVEATGWGEGSWGCFLVFDVGGRGGGETWREGG